MTPWPMLHGTFFSNATVLVTGGAGFIGSHLTRALLELGATVRVLDDLSGSDMTNIAPLAKRFEKKLTFAQGSILDQPLVDKLTQGCRFVFHQAALGSVPRSVAEPRLFTEVNVIGTLNVLEAARQSQVQRIMFAASSSAYGDTPTLPKIETMPPSPRSPYAANKVAGEGLLMAYACSYGIDTAPLRYFNIFGPHQNANSAYAAVIAAFAKALLAGKQPLIYGDGEQSRDFTYVDNAVHANLLAAQHDGRIEGQPMNVAVGQRVTVNELATQMATMMGRPDLTPVYEEERSGDVKHSLADLGLIQKVLRYKPVVPFAPGLKNTVDWYIRQAAQA